MFLKPKIHTEIANNFILDKFLYAKHSSYFHSVLNQCGDYFPQNSNFDTWRVVLFRPCGVYIRLQNDKCFEFLPNAFADCAKYIRVELTFRIKLKDPRKVAYKKSNSCKSVARKTIDIQDMSSE